MFLEPPSINEIINCINSLNVNKAVGHDNIPAYFLRVASIILAPYLFVLLEFAFKNGIFPKTCTIAKVIPLHKNGNKNDPNNYRPISILTCFSKIFEKLICKRLTAFLAKNKILVPEQYGFQKGISTSHAMLDIITAAFHNIDRKMYTGIFFLDLKKAFDTVSHEILLAKLNHYGIRGPAYSMIKSFLIRQQYVSLNNYDSQLCPNKFGVAQGSILGPILFLLYVNDMPNAVNSLPRLFADDTCLVLNNANLPNLQNDLNSEIDRLQNWCNANKLTINPSKSNYLVISPKANEVLTNCSVLLHNVSIKSITNAKYLGLQIDSTLTFQNHLRLIENKLSRALGMLLKLKSVLPQSALLKLYYALFHPHLLYGLVVWGSALPTHLKKITTLQNKAVKVIGGGRIRDNATPFYAKFKILKLTDLYKLEICKLVHDHLHNKLPSSLSNLFCKSQQISQRSTRSSSNPYILYIPRFRSKRLQRCIKYQGVTIWNSIPSDIQTLTKRAFKIKLKQHFIHYY